MMNTAKLYVFAPIGEYDPARRELGFLGEFPYADWHCLGPARAEDISVWLEGGRLLSTEYLGSEQVEAAKRLLAHEPRCTVVVYTSGTTGGIRWTRGATAGVTDGRIVSIAPSPPGWSGADLRRYALWVEEIELGAAVLEWENWRQVATQYCNE